MCFNINKIYFKSLIEIKGELNKSEQNIRMFSKAMQVVNEYKLASKASGMMSYFK